MSNQQTEQLAADLLHPANKLAWLWHSNEAKYHKISVALNLRKVDECSINFFYAEPEYYHHHQLEKLLTQQLYVAC
ncbi:hypothetical protein SAMN04488051_108125 [Alkalimonas amylolytica]|uniref:Uncharacterized protein n=1 Tax=Alkalimonas amylolytica TaxID=152573 RepID=A0A1H4F174_ALKAM|nr:hypothetical protein SAMN04488051_108125 [Alkalimonas amylolytica]